MSRTRTATRSETTTVAKRIVKHLDLSPLGEFDDVQIARRRDITSIEGDTGFVIVSDYADMIAVSAELRGTFKPGLWTEPINGSVLAVYVDAR